VLEVYKDAKKKRRRGMRNLPPIMEDAVIPATLKYGMAPGAEKKSLARVEEVIIGFVLCSKTDWKLCE